MKPARSSAIKLGLVHVPVGTAPVADNKRETKTEFIAPSGQKAVTVYRDPESGELLEGSRDALLEDGGLRRAVKRGSEYVPIPNSQWQAILERTKPEGIEVVGFVEPEALEARRDRIRDSHYVQPQAGAARAQALLAKAMRQAGRVAVVTWGSGSRQRLGVMRVRERDGAMEILTLRSAAELREPDEEVLSPTLAEVEDGPELKMAVDLIESMSADGEDLLDGWNDPVTDERNALIAEVVEGGEVAPVEAGEERKPAPDLMAAMQAEIEARKGAKKPAARKPAKRAAKKRAPAKRRAKAAA